MTSQEKQAFLTLKNRIFESPKKSHFFPKGLTYAFGQKMPFTFGQNKTKNIA